MKKPGIFLLIFVFAGMFSCTDQYTERFFQEDELTISAYLESNSNDYSMFLELLDKSGFHSAFNAYGTYTLFAFKNDAFAEYLNSKGYSAVSDMSIEDAKILVRYHALKTEISSSSLGFGKLPAKNLEDDELVSSFDSTGIQGIIINREAKIITRDIELSNGIIQVLDHTLTPVVESIVQKMEHLGNYSIFIDAAKATGYYSVLNKKYDTISSNEINRVYYTVFAESDAIFNNNGISNLTDLKAKYSNGINNPLNPLDSLNQFIANHILPEKNLFTKDLTTGNYQSYNGELINFFVDRTFEINSEGPDNNRTHITFIDGQTDYQAKNGVFHNVDKVLNIFYPEPVEVIWDFLDQPYARDLVLLGKRSTPVEPNLDNYPNMSGTISGIFGHFPSEGYGFLHKDALILNSPSWDFTVKMPIKIVKGKYRLILAVKNGSGRATVQVLVNGIPVGEPINLNGYRNFTHQEFVVSEINLSDTRENDIRFVTVVNGQGQLDYLKFEPI